MSTAFQSINVNLSPMDHQPEVLTPTTPRVPIDVPLPSEPLSIVEESAPTTPTRHSFGGVGGQRPLPDSLFSSSLSQHQQSSSQLGNTTLNREKSLLSSDSVDSHDVDMMDLSDEGEEGSEGESVDGESGRPSKKKKGQRFFCTDFPPCNLSFTRSEHLARHIRKHTGERPFQCHCARRFSRLDNLRQHAQTVHVNEEIPGDSLAATGTRFQRQIRTDRVRPSGSRSRASTASSQGSHVRNHSRNLSTSSIGSTNSTLSRDDSRRRPQPLMMASESPVRSRLTLDTMRAQNTTPLGPHNQISASPGGFSTPTSTTFSNVPSSPGYGSALGSPVSIGRNMWDVRTHGRRLSVPSGVNPFQSPHGSTFPPSHASPLTPSNGSVMSGNSSVFASPTSSTYSFSRPETTAHSEAEWRRRTWHPSTYSNHPRPATSGLSYYQTPDAPKPAFAPHAAAAATQPHRLPGIETFDQIIHHPMAPQNRGPSPMHVDGPSRPPVFSGPSEQMTTGPNDRRGHASWDMSLHRNIPKLDIASGTPPKDTRIFSQHKAAEIRDAGQQASVNAQAYPAAKSNPLLPREAQYRPADSINLKAVTPRRNKRHGWYNGPMPYSQQTSATLRPSPEDSSSSEGVPTPLTSSAEYHPSIIHSNGYIETHHSGAVAGNMSNACASASTQDPRYPLPSEPIRPHVDHTLPKDNDMSGLEALVAVATSEDQASASDCR